MKTLLFSSLAAIALFALVGYSATAGKIDTSKIQNAFKNAPAHQADLQNALKAVNSHDYPGALTSLQKIYSSPDITPEQKSATQDLVKEIQTKGLGGAMGGTGNLTNQTKGTGKGGAEDLQKQLK